jgi:predicted metalloprotease with PDZ domain
MSEHAPFADAGVANDTDDRARTFISYYTHGAALALGLDLLLRERSGGAVSLDDYMRRLWRDFGTPAAPHPGYVARPYDLADLRTTLAAVAGDRAFADDFFDRYVEGHDVVDYARLLGLAGYTLRLAAPGRGWAGDVRLAEESGGLRVGGSLFGGRPAVVPYGTPAYEAGLDLGDRIVAIDDQPATMARWSGLTGQPPGTRVRLTVERRDGARVTLSLTLRQNPALQVLANEDLGAPLTEAQRAFRARWLDGEVNN